MKKIKYLATALLIIVSIVSCTNDSGSSKVEVTEGAAPNIKKIPTTDQSIDIVGLKAGGNINLGLTIGIGRGNENVASMNVVGFYTKAGVTSKGILKSNITAFPATINITKTELFSAFSAIKSANDITISDKLFVSTEITLKDGRVIKMFNDNGSTNYGADIANSLQFSSSQSYVIACPLPNASIFNGLYKVTKDDWNDYSIGDDIPVVYDAAFGTLKFKILNTNNAGLKNAATSYMIVTVNSATAAVTVSSNEIFNYGGADITPVTGTGTVSACTGDINLKLNFSGFNSTNNSFNLVKK